MKPRKASRRARRSLGGLVGPQDGIDPRDLVRRKRDSSRGMTPRKTSQLCRQVAITLDELLAEQPDDVLRDLTVVDVIPAPDASRLLVTVAPGPVAQPVHPLTVIEHLHQAAGSLRSEIASAISRRRTPSLEFRYAGGTPID